jgi:hypothetical protein
MLHWQFFKRLLVVGVAEIKPPHLLLMLAKIRDIFLLLTNRNVF